MPAGPRGAEAVRSPGEGAWCRAGTGSGEILRKTERGGRGVAGWRREEGRRPGSREREADGGRGRKERPGGGGGRGREANPGEGDKGRGEERAGLSQEARACEIPAERWRQRSVAAEAERAGWEREGGRKGRREGRGTREEEGQGAGTERLPICGRRWAAPRRGTWLARSALASPRRVHLPPGRALPARAPPPLPSALRPPSRRKGPAE